MSGFSGGDEKVRLLAGRLILAKKNAAKANGNRELLFEVTSADEKSFQELEDALCEFDKEFGDYLHLPALASDNKNTFDEYKSQGNELVDLFIDFIDLAKLPRQPRFRIQDAKLKWRHWIANKPIPALLSEIHDVPTNRGVTEKAIRGELSIRHWLTDSDIRRTLAAKGLKDDIHVTRFNAKDIRLILHFERLKHAADLKPYHIFLIVNHGADLGSQGSHWARVRITVTPPNDVSAKYTDSLEVDVYRKKQLEKILTEAIKEQESFKEGNSVKTYQAFPQANISVECEGTGEQVGEQQPWSCGYRALFGTVKELQSVKAAELQRDAGLQDKKLADNDLKQVPPDDLALWDEKSAGDLRDRVFHTILSSAQFTQTDFRYRGGQPDEKIFDTAGDQVYKLKPDIIKSLITANKSSFSQTSLISKPSLADKKDASAHASHLDIGKLHEIEKINSLAKEFAKQRIIEELKTKITPTLDFAEILKLVEKKEDVIYQKAALLSAFNALRKHSNAENPTGINLLFQGYFELSLELRQFVKDELDKLPHIMSFAWKKNLFKTIDDDQEPLIGLTDHKDLSKSEQNADKGDAKQIAAEKEFEVFGKEIAARNHYLKLNNVVAPDESDLWRRAVLTWAKKQVTHNAFTLYTPYDLLTLQNLEKKDTARKDKNIAETRNRIFRKILETFLELNKSKTFVMPARTFEVSLHGGRAFVPEKELTDIDEDNIDAITEIAKNSPFEEYVLTGNSLHGDVFGAIKKLIVALKNSPIKRISLGITDYHLSLTLEQSKEIYDLIKEHQITTELEISVLIRKNTYADHEEKQKHDSIVHAIKNQIAFNRRKANKQKLTSKKAAEEEKKQIKADIRISTPKSIKLSKPRKSKEAQLDQLSINIDTLVTQQEEEQQQQQQQVQQQPQEQHILEAKPRKQDRIHGIVKDKNSLIDRKLFSTSEDLIEYYSTENRAPLVSERWLAGYWDRIVGIFPDPENTIKYLTKTATYQLLLHPNQVGYGLNRENLPQGFFLLSTPEGERVLDYDPTRHIENENESPLTLQLTPPYLSYLQLGDLQQFHLTDSSVNEDKIPIISDRKEFKLPVKPTLADLLALMQLEDRVIAQEIMNDDNFMQIIKDAEHFEGFSQIILEYGCVGMKLLLQHFVRLKNANAEYFDNFYKINAATCKNWLVFMEDKLLESFDKIATFPPNKMNWWRSLFLSHVSNDSLHDLPELIKAFDYFCKEYEKITKKSLPDKCPLMSVKNLKTGLDRLLSILQNAVNVEEQIAHLEGCITDESGFENLCSLDLSPDGAYYASRYEGFNLVTPEMELIPPRRRKQSAKSDIQSGYKVTFEQLQEAANHDPVSFYKFRPLFYRYLGRQIYIPKFADYIEFVDTVPEIKIQSQGASALSIQKALLTILAFTTSHHRGYRTDIKHEMNQLIQVIAQSPENNSVVLSQLLTWQGLEPPISLPEATSIAQTLIELDRKEIPGCNQKLREYFTTYKETFLKALVTRQQNPHRISRMSTTNFMKCLEHRETKGIPLDKLAHTLAISNSHAFMQQDYDDFISTLAKLKDSDEEAMQHILDIVSTINVSESGAHLPTFKKLTDIIRHSEAHKGYHNLSRFIEAELDGCVFHSVNRKYISAAPLDELIADLINEETVALARGFGLDLKWEELQRRKLDYLIEEINRLDFPLRIAAITFLKPKADKYIQGRLDEAIDAMILETENDKASLGNIIHTKLIPSHKDSLVLLRLKANHILETEAFLAQLRNIQAKWPQSLSALIACLNKSKTIGNEFCNIAFLTHLLEFVSLTFASHTSKPAFPLALINTIINHDKISAINDSFFEVMKQIIQAETFSLDSKQQLFNIAIATHTNKEVSRHTQQFISDLLSYQEINKKDSAGFKKLLSILDEKDPRILTEKIKHFNQFHAIFKQMDFPNRSDIIVRFFHLFESHYEKFDGILRQLQTRELKSADQFKNHYILAIIVLGFSQKTAAPSKYEHKHSPKAVGFESQDLCQKLQNLSNENLQKLLTLFSSKPTPTVDKLSNISNENVDTFIADFTSNPYGNRDLKAQFITKTPGGITVEDIINQITDITQGDTPLLLTQRQTLHKWFNVVNALGGSHPILESKRGHPSVKDLKAEDIQNLVAQFRVKMRSETTSEEEKLRIRLAFLAIAREAMYRGVMTDDGLGMWPNFTQIVSVLNALLQGRQVLSEIQTGQGKGLIASLYASLLWLEGRPVDICTSNIAQAQHDLDKYGPFYDILGIKRSASVIQANSNIKEYNPDGINYSDVPQLAIFRARNQIETQEAITLIPSLVLDEFDFTALDDKTQYRYAINLHSETGTPEKNAFEWIYPLLNDFIDSRNPTWSAYEDIINAIEFIKANAKEHEQKMFFDFYKGDLLEDQLDIWIDAALEAKELSKKENREKYFVIEREEKRDKKGNVIHADSFAHIIINDRPNKVARWSNGVHQFVHARLNADPTLQQAFEEFKPPNSETGLPKFKIEPETAPVTSINSKNFIDYYQKNDGRVWGITGTIGSLDERIELHKKYGFKMQRIPPHQRINRRDRKRVLAHNKEDHLKRIKAKMLDHLGKRPPMPMLFICKDVPTSKELHKFLSQVLQEKFKIPPNRQNLQLYNGADTIVRGSQVPLTKDKDEVAREKEIIQNAGLDGFVTISTPGMLGRGTDIQPKHRKGLFVLQTYVAIERTSRQIVGRSGRKGDFGETLLLANKEELLGYSSQKDESRIEATQAKLTRQSTRERRFREKQGDVIDYVFNKFLNILDKTKDAKSQHKLLLKWRNYLETMEKEWLTIKDTFGRYTRHENMGSKLTTCCQKMIQKAVEEWNKIEGLTATDKLELSTVAMDITHPEKPVDMTPAVKELRYRPLQSYTVNVDKDYLDLHPLDLTSPPATLSSETHSLAADSASKLSQKPESKKLNEYRKKAIANQLNIILAQLASISDLRSKLPKSPITTQLLFEQLPSGQKGQQLHPLTALLNSLQTAINKATKDNKPDIYIATLQNYYYQVINVVTWSENTTLQNLVFSEQAFEDFGQFVIEMLRNYRKASFLSKDRKQNVDSLISSLSEEKSALRPPSVILKEINQAQRGAIHENLRLNRKARSRYLDTLAQIRRLVIARADVKEIKSFFADEINHLDALIGMIPEIKSASLQNLKDDLTQRLAQIKPMLASMAETKSFDINSFYKHIVNLFERIEHFRSQEALAPAEDNLLQLILTSSLSIVNSYKKAYASELAAADSFSKHHRLANRALQDIAVDDFEIDPNSKLFIYSETDKPAQTMGHKLIAAVKKQMLAASPPGSIITIPNAELRKEKQDNILHIKVHIASPDAKPNSKPKEEEFQFKINSYGHAMWQEITPTTTATQKSKETFKLPEKKAQESRSNPKVYNENKLIRTKTTKEILTPIENYLKSRTVIISSDRKINANTLLSKMKVEAVFSKQLESLNTARKDALQSDLSADQSKFSMFKRGSKSRYQDLLESAREQIVENAITSKSENFADVLKLEYQDLSNILDILLKRLSKHENSDLISAIEKCFELLNDKELTDFDLLKIILDLQDSIKRYQNEINATADKTIIHLVNFAQKRSERIKSYFAREDIHLSEQLAANPVLQYRDIAHKAANQALEQSRKSPISKESPENNSQYKLLVSAATNESAQDLSCDVQALSYAVIRNLISQIQSNMPSQSVEVTNAALDSDRTKVNNFVLNVKLNVENAPSRNTVSVKFHIDPEHAYVGCQWPKVSEDATHNATVEASDIRMTMIY